MYYGRAELLELQLRRWLGRELWHLREMVAAHEIEWEERFGEGSRVRLSTSALMVHPPLDGISGQAACKSSEQNKLKVVKATLLEPVFGSKERS